MHLTSIAIAQKKNRDVYCKTNKCLWQFIPLSSIDSEWFDCFRVDLRQYKMTVCLFFWESFSQHWIGAVLHLIELKQKRNDTTLPAKPESTASVSDGNRWLKDTYIFFQHLHRMLFVWYLWFAAFKQQICIHWSSFFGTFSVDWAFFKHVSSWLCSYLTLNCVRIDFEISEGLDFIFRWSL